MNKKINANLLSFLSALGVLVYVTLIAWFMFNIQTIFGNKPDNFLAPVFMLLLFIVSATITGILVLGQPIKLYLDNAKKEAFKLLFTTVLWLLIFLFIVIIILFLR